MQPGSVTVVLGNGGSAVDRLRREALTYVADDLANDGAAGEEDAVLGAEFFAAGAGADLLVGEHGEEDNLGFVAGVDVTRFRAWYPTPLPLEVEAGDDTARGGRGKDRHYLDGDDRGFGGPDADRIWGDAGRDRLLGRGGRNRLDGGAERDRCRGGSRLSVVLRCEA